MARVTGPFGRGRWPRSTPGTDDSDSIPARGARLAGLLQNLERALSETPLHTAALYLLGQVPGFPPLIQTLHILGVSAIMGSIVLIDLKILGLALPGQSAGELVRRLMPWTWWALPTLAVSGLVFVFAQPHRYFANPVFGLKFAMLAPALLLTAVRQRATVRDPQQWNRSLSPRRSAKLVAALSLLLWVGVVTAGRWIAYADYLFEME